jgi:catechol 2,3-dioxygenase-like lactoylglutathione lyase family enzyme
MESIISNLVARFEKGSLSRRELVQGLAMLAASGTAATAQEDINFKAANIDHVSVQVADIQRSTDFYRKMFGFTVVSQAEEGGVKIVRLGNTRTLVSLNHGGPPGTVDHFAIGIPRHSRESITSYLTQHGATPLQGNFAGLHVKDPDGVNVQISAQTWPVQSDRRHVAIRWTMAVVPTNERAAARSGALTVLRRGYDGVGDRRRLKGAHHSPIAIAAPDLVQ